MAGAVALPAITAELTLRGAEAAPAELAARTVAAAAHGVRCQQSVRLFTRSAGDDATIEVDVGGNYAVVLLMFLSGVGVLVVPNLWAVAPESPPAGPRAVTAADVTAVANANRLFAIKLYRSWRRIPATLRWVRRACRRRWRWRRRREGRPKRRCWR